MANHCYQWSSQLIWTDNHEHERFTPQVGYYLYCLTTRGSGHVTASLLGLCLGSALANAYVLYKQVILASHWSGVIT